MTPTRLNALTDGVVAIVLTIMVLELKFPAEATVQAVLAVLPLLAAYLLAFVNVAIYWNNHHHLMSSARKVTGGVLWSNHALLFWLTLFPLMIRWIDEAGITPLPVASFGVVLVGAAISYQILERALIHAEGEGSGVKRALGAGAQGNDQLRALRRVHPGRVHLALHLDCDFHRCVDLPWVIPDRRFERA